MFIVLLLTIAKICKQPNWPSVDKKAVVHYAMEYYSAIKKKELLPFETAYVDLETIMLSELSRSVKHRYNMILLIWGV